MYIYAKCFSLSFLCSVLTRLEMSDHMCLKPGPPLKDRLDLFIAIISRHSPPHTNLPPPESDNPP